MKKREPLPPVSARSIAMISMAMMGALFVGAPPRAEAAGHSCSGCHDRSSSATEGGPAAKPGAEVCLRCHDSILRGEASPSTRIGTRTRSLAYGHLRSDGETYEAVTPGPGGRAVRLDCLTCHAPHPNGRRYQLRVPDPEGRGAADLDEADDVSRLCLSCHAEQGRFRSGGGLYTRHPLGIPSQDARRARAARLPLFDVRGTEDESDDVIGCATCHFVHGSPEENLLRWSRREVREACGSCHRDVYDPELPVAATVAGLR